MSQTLRLTGGRASGRPIRVVDSPLVRPALAVVRKSLFDILGGHVTDANVLDLFAGGGSLGLEAVSRGARFCCFVENNRRCVETIRANVRDLAFDERCAVIAVNAFASVNHLPPAAGGYGLVFIAPPYRYYREAPFNRRLAGLLTALASSPAISPDALLVAEHPEEADITAPPPSLVKTDERGYGRTFLGFYKKNA